MVVPAVASEDSTTLEGKVKRIQEEAEVIVRLDYLDKQAHICVGSWPRMAAKMKRLYGESLDKGERNQSQRWRVPMRCFSFRSLKPRNGTIPDKRPSTQRDSAGG